MSYYKRKKFIKKLYKNCDLKTNSKSFCDCKVLSTATSVFFYKGTGLLPSTLLKSETPAQLFSCEFWKIFQSSFFVNLWLTAFLKRTFFRYTFPGNFVKRSYFCSCQKQFLKESTLRLVYQRLEKQLRNRRSSITLQVLRLWLYLYGTTKRTLCEEYFEFFGTAISQNTSKLLLVKALQTFSAFSVIVSHDDSGKDHMSLCLYVVLFSYKKV